MKKNICRFLLAFVILLVSACLDGREEFWFERNGSGRLEAQYQLPAFAIAAMGGEDKLEKVIREFFTREKSLVIDALAIEKREGQSIIQIKAHFNSVIELSKILDTDSSVAGDELPDSIRKLLGVIEAQREGLSIKFNRRVDPSGLIGGGLLAPSNEQLEGRQLLYTIHLPTKATASNAHEVRDNGRTLVWRYPLAEALTHPVETNFVAPIPLPTWLLTCMVVLVMLLAWAVASIIKKRYRKNELSTSSGSQSCPLDNA